MPKDLYGDEIIQDVLLRDRFIEPPFSVLDTKSGHWQNRRRQWLAKGLKSEIGRGDNIRGMSEAANNGYGQVFSKSLQATDEFEEKYGRKGMNGTSIFDPVLCELMYRWFCPDGGHALDPFAGGSVRCVVAHMLGYRYTGIELRQEQVDANREQGLEILPVTNQPQWYQGDSDAALDGFAQPFDFMLSCPPYFDLERYSDDPLDLSTMPWAPFRLKYRSIIAKACRLLKPGALAAWVVGEVRAKDGSYIGFVPATIAAFRDAGLAFYNDAVLLNSIGSAPIRAGKQFTSAQKLVKVHQNVLVFKKPEE